MTATAAAARLAAAASADGDGDGSGSTDGDGDAAATAEIEQALVAMLVARAQSCAVAPAADYVTKPGRAEGVAPTAMMHHYVAESKRWYFRHGWRRVLAMQ